MRPILVASAAFLAATLAPCARAHAFLDHSEPKVGSSSKRSPREIRLWFTEGLEPVFSTAQVWNENRKEVDRKDAHLDPRDDALLEVAVPPLPAGTYTVTWSVVAKDTHRTEGRFRFTLRPRP